MTAIAECSERTIDCFAKQMYEVPDVLHIVGSDVEFAALAARLKKAFDRDATELGCFRIMSQTDGDKRVVWCRRVIAEIAAAKKMFLDLLSKGMMPYKVGVDGQATAEIMKEFDPIAEEIIFVPIKAISGG